MKKVLLGVFAAYVAASPAFANTSYWRDTVTFVEAASVSNPSCIFFQTSQTNGVLGVNNVSGGDTGATGYTGTAQWNVVGAGTGSGTAAAVSGLVAALLENSRLSGGQYLVNWVDLGANQTQYADCPDDASNHAAKNIGQ